MIAIKRIN